MKRATYECPFQNLLFEKRKKLLLTSKQKEKFREIDELLPIPVFSRVFTTRTTAVTKLNTKDEQKNVFTKKSDDN